MGKYQDASLYYGEMIKSWQRFEAGKDKGNNYGKFINNAVQIAKLGLPNPFDGKEDVEEEQEDTAGKTEEVKTELNAAVLSEIEDGNEAQAESKKKFGFKRK